MALEDGFELYVSTYIQIFFFIKCLYCFQPKTGSPWLYTANWMHWSVSFYTGDLSISRFWHLLGSWNLLFMDTEGSEVLGESKSYTDLDCSGIYVPKPYIVQSQLHCVMLSSRGISQEASGQHCLPLRQFSNNPCNLWGSLPVSQRSHGFPTPRSLSLKTDISAWEEIGKKQTIFEKKHQLCLSSGSLRSILTNWLKPRILEKLYWRL